MRKKSRWLSMLLALMLITQPIAATTLSITSIAAPGDSSYEEQEIGPGSEVDDGEQYEEDADIKPPDLNNVTDEKVDVGDIVTSETVKPINGKTRVTEVYSINNQLADCYFKPKADEVPLLGNHVLKLGQYAGAYTGFFDIGWTDVAKPKGEQSRALEILGYDFLLTDESYNTSTKKYVRQTLGTQITQETAVMNVYKALGLELYSTNMYHEKADYTSGTSPAANELRRSTLQYYLNMSDGYGTLRFEDTLDSYRTYVFVTRTNPDLYMKKLANDLNISYGQSKKGIMTLADFIVMCARMMDFYGEPVISEQEQNLLLQAYGAQVPVGMSSDLQDAWIYLKSRGCLEVSMENLYEPLKRGDMFDILMRIKDKESRTNYKEIQLTYELNTNLVNNGYYPQEVIITETEESVLFGDIDYTQASAYDYLVPISEYSRFLGLSGEEVNTQFISDNPEALGMQLEGASYAGIVEDKYYHYIIPINSSDSARLDGTYYRVDTLSVDDKPGAIMLQNGGGIYKFNQKQNANGEEVNYFIRRPFESLEYSDYVDEQRKYSDRQWDNSLWGEDKVEDAPFEEEETKPVTPGDLGDWDFYDWDGPTISNKVITGGQWIKDEQNGKWRYYYYDENKTNREYLVGTEGYYIGPEPVGNIPEHYYLFDNDGYMVTGWYQEGRLWAYFDENGHLTVDQTITIDGQEYEFDQFGWWIDMNYNVPEDREDIWSYYTNISGQWAQDEDGRWWYMTPDGEYLISDFYRINDRMYYFDDDGWMVTGWVEYNDMFFYMDDADGYMLTNTTTPDGYRVGQNGAALGKVKQSTVAAVWNGIKSIFTPMTTYAAGYNYRPVNNSLGNLTYNTGGKMYSTYVLKSAITNSYEDMKRLLPDCDIVQTNNGFYKIFGPKSPEIIGGILSFKSNSSNDYEYISGLSITQLSSDRNSSNDMSMLVPYDMLVEAGLFGIDVSISGDVLTLHAVALDTSPASIAGTGNVNGKKAKSMGTIYLDRAKHTIMVGPTIYKVRDNQVLWEMLPSSDNSEDLFEKTYQILDADGNVAKSTGSALYVDIRAIYGWASNEFDFVRMKKTIDTNLSNGGANSSVGQVIISPKRSDPSIRPYVESFAVSKNSNANSQIFGGDILDYSTFDSAVTMRIIPKYYKDYAAVLASNGYPLADWALLVTNSSNGSETCYNVNYYPKKAFTSLSVPLPNTADDMNKLKAILPEGQKIPDSQDYVVRVTDIKQGGNGTFITKAGDDSKELKPGRWYLDEEYGYVYLLPHEAEWNQTQGSFDGYGRWLNGEYMTPLTWDLYKVIDHSVPYIEGTKFGETKVNDIGGGATGKITIPFSALSYYLFAEQQSAQVVSNVLPENSNNPSSLLFMGKFRITKSGNKYTINGLTNGSLDKIELTSAEQDSLRVLHVNDITRQSIVGGSSNIKIYVVQPAALNYVVATGEQYEEGVASVGTDNPLDLFRDFDAFKLSDWIKLLQETLSFLILFATYVIPFVGYIASVLVLGFALMADFKGVQWFCNKVFDPIKLLTLGVRDVNNCRGPRFIISVVLVCIFFALSTDGNIIRVFNWLFRFIGEYFRMFSQVN